MALRSGISVSFTAIRSNWRGKKSGALTKELDKYCKEFADDIVEKVRTYPPQKFSESERIASDYKRTRRLYNAWRVRPTGGGIGYIVRNDVTDIRKGNYYARLVHGGSDGSGQWWHHAESGWYTMDWAVDQLGGREGFAEGAQYIIEDHMG